MPRWLSLTPVAVAGLAFALSAVADEELGRFSANPFDPESTGNPMGAGSVHRANGVNNPASPFGSAHGHRSANNPAATDPPRLYDDDGNYRGRLSTNPHHPDSIANPHGRFGNPRSPDSVNNPDGPGNPLRADSPANPGGRGWRIVGASADPDAHGTRPAPASFSAEPAPDGLRPAASAATRAPAEAAGPEADAVSNPP